MAQARGVTPRERIARECDRRGKERVVAGCIALLRNAEVDDELILVLGGPTARAYLGEAGRVPSYWLRVWAARGLLWAWDDAALDAVVAALDDEAWRVREMALKVVARHRLEDALDEVADLQDDAVPRVRAAASRALIRITSTDS